MPLPLEIKRNKSKKVSLTLPSKSPSLSFKDHKKYSMLRLKLMETTAKMKMRMRTGYLTIFLKKLKRNLHHNKPSQNKTKTQINKRMLPQLMQLMLVLRLKPNWNRKLRRQIWMICLMTYYDD